MISRRTMIGFLLTAIPASAGARPARTTLINVYKSPVCGCCGAWVEHLRASGLQVAVHELDDVGPVARKAGVPDSVRSCHTALIGGYFVEGHVPATDIRKLLHDRPNARGISVPGMPIGSPGMEQDARKEPFATLIVDRGGAPRVFTRHNQPAR